jgi:hypothetical protein
LVFGLPRALARFFGASAVATTATVTGFSSTFARAGGRPNPQSFRVKSAQSAKGFMNGDKGFSGFGFIAT